MHLADLVSNHVGHSEPPTFSHVCFISTWHIAQTSACSWILLCGTSMETENQMPKCPIWSPTRTRMFITVSKLYINSNSWAPVLSGMSSDVDPSIASYLDRGVYPVFTTQKTGTSPSNHGCIPVYCSFPPHTWGCSLNYN